MLQHFTGGCYCDHNGYHSHNAAQCGYASSLAREFTRLEEVTSASFLAHDGEVTF